MQESDVGLVIMLDDGCVQITIETNFSSLDIREAFTEDSDTYTVVIKNMVGEAHSSCKLTIESFYSSAVYVIVTHHSLFSKQCLNVCTSTWTRYAQFGNLINMNKVDSTYFVLVE